MRPVHRQAAPSRRRPLRAFSLHGNRFYEGDCAIGARRRLASGSVDLIVTDPPYGIGGDTLHKHYNRKEAFVVDGYVEVPAAGYAAFTKRWVNEAARVLRPGGQIYVISGYTHLPEVLNALRNAGLEEVNHIIWRYNFGVFTRRKFVSSHYHVLYYAKPGGRRTFNTECRYGLAERLPDGSSLNYRDREDVWVINREYKPGQVKNKNELPQALLAKIIEYSSDPGDLVCDFFLGGFSTARVAIGLGRRATGFEISPALFNGRFASLSGIRPGDLTGQLRRPRIEPPRNQGRRWTPEEVRRLRAHYLKLRASRATKKEALGELARHFGRGRFAILNALGRGSASQGREPGPGYGASGR